MRDRVRVRISSEAAGAIAMTPVVVQEMAIAELAEHLVTVCGKDVVRVGEVVRRGSMVSGGSRLRWEAWEPEAGEVEALLARFPDPDPARIFEAERCVMAVLRAGSQQITVPREAAAKTRLFRRRSFWHHVLEIAAGAAYVEYSYREKADVYRVHISPEMQQALREASELLTYSSVSRQLQAAAVHAMDLYVRR